MHSCFATTDSFADVHSLELVSRKTLDMYSCFLSRVIETAALFRVLYRLLYHCAIVLPILNGIELGQIAGQLTY